MLFLFTILVVLLGIFAVAILAKRLASQNLLEENPHKNLAAEEYRPLFAPTEEDLREFEAEEEAQAVTKQAEELRLILKEKLVNLEKIRQTWRESPSKTATIELLYLASQAENSEAYLETAEAVVEAWRTGEIPGLTADDLAHLLDSHFWLLPTHERTPGVSFRIQQETADLRRKSE